MTKSNPPGPKPGSNRRHVIWLSERDMDAARRLIGLLAEEGRAPEALEADAHDDAANGPDRKLLLQRAREQYFLRQRRREIFGKQLESEHAFDLLVSLYVFEGREGDLTASRLTEISRMTASSVLRWLGILQREGFIRRKAVRGDRRLAQITLTDRARHALEQLLGWDPQ